MIFLCVILVLALVFQSFVIAALLSGPKPWEDTDPWDYDD